jgi:hypothetical protein
MVEILCLIIDSFGNEITLARAALYSLHEKTLDFNDCPMQCHLLLAPYILSGRNETIGK